MAFCFLRNDGMITRITELCGSQGHLLEIISNVVTIMLGHVLSPGQETFSNPTSFSDFHSVPHYVSIDSVIVNIATRRWFISLGLFYLF